MTGSVPCFSHFAEGRLTLPTARKVAQKQGMIQHDATCAEQHTETCETFSDKLVNKISLA